MKKKIAKIIEEFKDFTDGTRVLFLIWRSKDSKNIPCKTLKDLYNLITYDN